MFKFKHLESFYKSHQHILVEVQLRDTKACVYQSLSR